MSNSFIRMRHIRCFVSVARLGNVTRAADELGTVQPAVSRSIKELEVKLGANLFVRTANGMDLTEDGKTFYEYMSVGLRHIERGIDIFTGKMEGQKIRAYILPNVVRTIMPGAVKRFKAHYPHIDLEFLPTTGGGLRENLLSGQVDFGFGRLIAIDQMSGLNFEHLFSEPLRFFTRSGHVLGGKDDLTVQDINEFPVVLPASNTIIRSEVDKFLLSEGKPKLSNVIETLSFEFARNLMLESDAIVCHPIGAMKREVAAGQAAILRYAENAMDGVVGITTATSAKLSAPSQLLIQMIREEVQLQYRS